MPDSGKRHSVLLATAASSGTIAAVRHLGSMGVDVGVISSGRLCAAVWSRRAARTYSAPAESDSQRFLDALLEIGAANPGQILIPTSDETAWLYTERAAELKRHFFVYQPSIAGMQRILDKKLLEGAATSVGLAVLPSWDPRSMDDVAAIASTLPYPILIKPRTHVHRLRNDKGIVVRSKSELMRQYQQFVTREEQRAADHPLLQDAGLPILQQFVDAAGQGGVRSVTGFIDRTGELFVTRLSTKVFQRSQPVGVGVCFQSLPTNPDLSDAARRLCRELSYFGIFEIEFVNFNGQWAVIDFNPRFFNQMGMDINRGMPLPLLACLDAAGESTVLRNAVATAQQDVADSAVFYDSFTFHAILLAQVVTSRMSRRDCNYWREWMKKNARYAVDAAADRSDPMPGIVHAFSEIYLGVRAIPRFLRSTSEVGP